MKVGDVVDLLAGKAVILEYRSCNDILIEFIDTGYQRTASASNIRKGKVKDNLKRTMYGVGYMGEGKYGSASKGFLEYVYWSNMFKRCFSNKETAGNACYGETEIDERFHNYQDFAAWCNAQVGFGNKGWHLEKDILSQDVKIYSPDTCVFVPPEVNYFLVGKDVVGQNRSARQYRYYERNKKAKAISLAERYKEVIDSRVYEAILEFQPKTI